MGTPMTAIETIISQLEAEAGDEISAIIDRAVVFDNAVKLLTAELNKTKKLLREHAVDARGDESKMVLTSSRGNTATVIFPKTAYGLSKTFDADALKAALPSEDSFNLYIETKTSYSVRKGVFNAKVASTVPDVMSDVLSISEPTPRVSVAAKK